MKLSVSLMFSIGFRAFPAQRNRDALWAGKSRDLGLLLGYCICCSDQTEVRVLAAAADKAAARRRGRNLERKREHITVNFRGYLACLMVHMLRTNEGILSSRHIIISLFYLLFMYYYYLHPYTRTLLHSKVFFVNKHIRRYGYFTIILRYYY